MGGLMVNLFFTEYDTDTFELKIIQNLSFLKKIATKYVHNEDDLNDLVQDTVYKAFKHKDKFEINSNVKGWLTTILKNTFINQNQKNKYKNFFIDIDSIILESDSIHSAKIKSNAYTIHIDTKYSVSDNYDSALKNLSFINQTMILMCDIEGFSYLQIAEYLGCPIGTVRSGIYRSRKYLLRAYRKVIKQNNV